MRNLVVGYCTYGVPSKIFDFECIEREGPKNLFCGSISRVSRPPRKLFLGTLASTLTPKKNQAFSLKTAIMANILVRGSNLTAMLIKG